MPYRIIDDLTSDVLFEATGKDLAELFSSCATALFSVICEIEEVQALHYREIYVSGKTLADTLHAWLQELLVTSELEEMFFCRFEMVQVSEHSVQARAFGEEATPEKGRTVVKAVTNYKFSVRKIKSGYRATVSLDI